MVKLALKLLSSQASTLTLRSCFPLALLPQEVRCMKEFQRNLDFCCHFARKLAYYFVSVRTFVYFALVVSLFSLLILGGNHGLAMVYPVSCGLTCMFSEVEAGPP